MTRIQLIDRACERLRKGHFTADDSEDLHSVLSEIEVEYALALTECDDGWMLDGAIVVQVIAALQSLKEGE